MLSSIEQCFCMLSAHFSNRLYYSSPPWWWSTTFSKVEDVCQARLWRLLLLLQLLHLVLHHDALPDDDNRYSIFLIPDTLWFSLLVYPFSRSKAATVGKQLSPDWEFEILSAVFFYVVNIFLWRRCLEVLVGMTTDTNAQYCVLDLLKITATAKPIFHPCYHGYDGVRWSVFELKIGTIWLTLSSAGEGKKKTTWH